MLITGFFVDRAVEAEHVEDVVEQAAGTETKGLRGRPPFTHDVIGEIKESCCVGHGFKTAGRLEAKRTIGIRLEFLDDRKHDCGGFEGRAARHLAGWRS